MITSTGNNFGHGPIEIKDYQDDRLVVLNAKFTIDPKSEAYLDAEVLEIYLPDLSIPKSPVASCYMGAMEVINPGKYNELRYQIGTVLKTWIKDRNTVCIEKLPIYDDMDEITIWICSMYPTVGKRGEVTTFVKTRVDYQVEETNVTVDDLEAVVQDGWCFLHLYFSRCGAIQDNVPVVGNLDGFPTDVSIDVPMMGGSHDAVHPGATYVDVKIENGVLTIANPTVRMSNSGYRPLLLFFAVRDTVSNSTL